jgi:hypothetical protein
MVPPFVSAGLRINMAALEDGMIESQRPEVLEAQLREVENSIEHLRRSNCELAEALAAVGGNDPDFREAINENIVIILRRTALATEIRSALDQAVLQSSKQKISSRMNGLTSEVSPEDDVLSPEIQTFVQIPTTQVGQSTFGLQAVAGDVVSPAPLVKDEDGGIFL